MKDYAQDYDRYKVCLRGTSHQRLGLPCQDAAEITVLKNKDWVYRVAVVCDGLGSAPRADIASQIACEVIKDYFKLLLIAVSKYNFDSKRKYISLETIVKAISFKVIAADLIRMIREQMEKEAEKSHYPVEHLDTTLNFVFMDVIGEQALVGRLGDGAIVIMKESGSEVMTDGTTSLSTVSVQSEDAESELELRLIDMAALNVLGFMLTTDGLEGEIYWKNSSIPKQKAADYFNSVWTSKNRKELTDEIMHLQNSTDCFDDDMSLVILSRARIYSRKISLPLDPTWKCGKCRTQNDILAGYCSCCGRDFHMFYGGINFQQYGGRIGYFKMLNEKDEVAPTKN